MWIIWIILGVAIAYLFYALISSKIILNMMPKKNKCRYCIHKENGVCQGVNPDEACVLQRDNSQ